MSATSAKLSIGGVNGELMLPVESAYELALTLVIGGYSVELNGVPVVAYYGPGYDYLVRAADSVDMRSVLGIYQDCSTD